MAEIQGERSIICYKSVEGDFDSCRKQFTTPPSGRKINKQSVLAWRIVEFGRIQQSLLVRLNRKSRIGEEASHHMEFYEVVNKRRSVREFESKPVEADKLQRILEAGLKAPSHNHLREWEFILVKNSEQRVRVVEAGAKAENVTDNKALEVAVRDFADDLQREMYLKALSIQKRMLLSSPELLVVCFRMKKPLKMCETLYELNNFASVWACIENILLAMATENLYGVTYIPHETSILKRILDIPADYEVASLIPIGYPKPYEVKQKPAPLQGRIHLDKW